MNRPKYVMNRPKRTLNGSMRFNSKYSLKKSFWYYILLLCPVKISYKIYTQKGFYMWIADHWKDYEVLDTSSGEKLERWGDYILVRPDPQVIWKTPHDHRRTVITTEVPRAAENGSSSICRMNGRSITPCLFRRKPPVRLIL